MDKAFRSGLFTKAEGTETRYKKPKQKQPALPGRHHREAKDFSGVIAAHAAE